MSNNNYIGNYRSGFESTNRFDDNNSGRTKLNFGEFGVETSNPETAWEFLVGGFCLVGALLGLQCICKKDEDNNKSNNKIKVNNNLSANRIKENSASTDEKIRLKKFEYEQKMELERLKHEQWKDKQEYKKAKTGLVLPEIAAHPLLSEVDIEPVSRKLNDFDSAEVKQAEELYDNFIYKDETTIIFSPTNVGKSFASIQIGAEISEKFPNTQTLYYNQEMNDSQIKSLLYGNEKRPKYAENMEIISNVCTEEELIKDMILNIEQYRKDLVIFIDNITDLFPSSRNEKATEFLKLLKRIRINAKRIYGIDLTYVIICHTNKIVKNSKLELNNLKGSGNLSNFADRIIAIGQVPNHNDKRYSKILKGRNGAVVSDVVMIFKIVDEKPRLRFIGEAKEEDVLIGNYKEPKMKLPNNIAEKWYQDHLSGKGYGTIAREYYKLDKISDNDSEEMKQSKKAEFERCTNKVRNEILKYKKTLK